jgi:hypothetical protein
MSVMVTYLENMACYRLDSLCDRSYQNNILGIVLKVKKRYSFPATGLDRPLGVPGV